MKKLHLHNHLYKLISLIVFINLTHLISTVSALAKTLTAQEAVEKSAQIQIKNILEPLLNKYCPEECKLLSIQIAVDLATPEEVAPGFDDIDPSSVMDLVPSNATAKLLLDEKVGPVTRSKILELIQQHLDTLDYPVKIDTQVTRFPQPAGAAGKVAEIRDRISKQFKNSLQELFLQFCPDHCMLVDYDLRTDIVNAEEANYGTTGEYFEDGGVAVRVRGISGTVLIDEIIAPEIRNNILEMARLKVNSFKNVDLTTKSLKFPRPPGYVSNLDSAWLNSSGISSNKNTSSKSDSTTRQNTNSQSSSQSNNESSSQSRFNSTAQNNLSENNLRQERFERFEKIERVENGDAIQKELDKFKLFGLIFACSVISLLIFVAFAAWKQKSQQTLSFKNESIPSLLGQNLNPRQENTGQESENETSSLQENPSGASSHFSRRFEIQHLKDELLNVFAQNPRVAKHVFSRILTEEGVETSAMYMEIFGESVFLDMIHDSSLQNDLNDLMEFYAKTQIELKDEETLELLKRLHNRTVSGKLFVLGSRSSNLFEFLSDMDGMQILELIRNESLTVKSIVLTQIGPQKRASIYAQLDENIRFKLMTELSRIDYLPRDYIYNVATALKRKRKENPRLNTEALPGSDVLLTLLERANVETQRTVIKNLELSNPDNARNIKSKLVSIETLRFLQNAQLLEVVLSLKHDELLQFLKSASSSIVQAIFEKAPQDLVVELEEELQSLSVINRETYQIVERKLINRVRLMAQDGLINLIETNDRMLSEATQNTNYIQGPEKIAA